MTGRLMFNDVSNISVAKLLQPFLCALCSTNEQHANIFSQAEEKQSAKNFDQPDNGSFVFGSFLINSKLGKKEVIELQCNSGTKEANELQSGGLYQESPFQNGSSRTVTAGNGSRTRVPKNSRMSRSSFCSTELTKPITTNDLTKVGAKHKSSRAQNYLLSKLRSRWIIPPS